MYLVNVTIVNVVVSQIAHYVVNFTLSPRSPLRKKLETLILRFKGLFSMKVSPLIFRAKIFTNWKYDMWMIV